MKIGDLEIRVVPLDGCPPGMILAAPNAETALAALERLRVGEPLETVCATFGVSAIAGIVTETK